MEVPPFLVDVGKGRIHTGAGGAGDRVTVCKQLYLPYEGVVRVSCRCVILAGRRRLGGDYGTGGDLMRG